MQVQIQHPHLSPNPIISIRKIKVAHQHGQRWKATLRRQGLVSPKVWGNKKVLARVKQGDKKALAQVKQGTKYLIYLLYI